MIGDGRCDSPGYNAKYGTYTLMDSDSGEILDARVIHVGNVDNSTGMEKKYLHVLHQFDIWHVGKSIKKKNSKLGKKKDNQYLLEWLKSIINHFWWCCASCNGDISELKEKWASILHHVSNIHSWEGNTVYHQCTHSDLSTGRRKKWLNKTSPAFKALESVIKDKLLVRNLVYLTNFCHTGSLEVYHSLYNKYCPKRLHFSYESMIARTQLAILDFNAGVSLEQARTNRGQLRFKQQFSRVNGSWVVKKVKEKNNRIYLKNLKEEAFHLVSSGEEVLLPNITFPSNIAPCEKPDKEESIQCKRTRFSV